MGVLCAISSLSGDEKKLKSLCGFESIFNDSLGPFLIRMVIYVNMYACAFSLLYIIGYEMCVPCSLGHECLSVWGKGAREREGFFPRLFYRHDYSDSHEMLPKKESKSKKYLLGFPLYSVYAIDKSNVSRDCPFSCQERQRSCMHNQLVHLCRFSSTRPRFDDCSRIIK